MQKKLIITAAGAFGLGALVGWAITGDYHEARSRAQGNALRQVIRDDLSLIYDLRQELGQIPVRTSHTNSELLEVVADVELDSMVNPIGVKKTIVDGRLVSTADPIDEIGADEGQTDEHGYRPVEDPTDEWNEKLEFEEGGMEIVRPIEEVTVEDEDESPAFPEGETLEETTSNLQRIIEQYTSSEDVVDHFVKEAVRTVDQSYIPPEVISQAQYSSDPDEGDDFAKVTLTWYPKQRVLLDDGDEPIEDVNGHIGWHSLRQFGWATTDPNIVFVRNRRLETDFEVVKDDENELPLHVKYGMDKETYRSNKAAGLLNFERGASD